MFPVAQGSHLLIPDHELLARIGRGSYGEVWLAQNETTGARRAIKIVHRKEFADQRPFEREFQGLLKFEPTSRSHPSQLAILHVGRNDEVGCFYYIMELADDASGAEEDQGAGLEKVQTYEPRTLRWDLERRGALPVKECIEIARQLSIALEHLHANGLIHRDVKPSNIVFVNGIPKLADIGLVTDVSDACSIVGTEGYLPPEGPGTPSGDLFSLGRVLYEAATGMDRRKFPALPPDLKTRPDRAELVQFNEILIRLGSLDPKRRYANAAELHRELALLEAGQSIRRLRWLERQVGWLKRGAASFGAAAVVLALLSGFAFAQARRARHLAEERLRALYVADVSSAQKMYEAGRPSPAIALLDKYKPQKGQEDLRGFEWRYLRARCAQNKPLFSLDAHPGGVNSLALSRDGTILASGGEDGKIRLWDVATRKVSATLEGHVGAVNCVAFSQTADLLASAGADGTVRVWDPLTRRERHRLSGGIGPLNVLKFSPDGSELLCGGKTATLLRWRTDTWSESSTEIPIVSDGTPFRWIWSIDFSGTGSRLVLGRPFLLQVLSYPSLQLLTNVAAGGYLGGVAVAPDEQLLAFGSENSRVYLLETGSWKRVGTIQAHDLHVNACLFLKDGSAVISGGADNIIRYSDPGSEKALLALSGHTGPVTSLALSAEGDMLMSGSKDGKIFFWAAKRGPTETLMHHGDWSQKLAFSPNGKWLASAHTSSQLTLWDIATSQALKKWSLRKYAGSVWSLSFSPDSRTLVTTSRDGGASVWDIPSCTEHGSVPVGPTGSVALADISSDGISLATTGENAPTCIWNLKDLSQRFCLQPARDSTKGQGVMKFSPDGKLLAVSDTSSVNLWNPFTGVLVGTLGPVKSEIWEMSFSPDGQLLATSGPDSLITLWTLNTFLPIARMDGAPGAYTTAFSPDGKTLAAGYLNSEIKLWNVTTRSELATFRSHPNFVRSVAFSPDGNLLASSSTAGDILLWRAPSLSELDRTLDEELPFTRALR